jgi:exosome complex exonuclease DIS3/RRP44
MEFFPSHISQSTIEVDTCIRSSKLVAKNGILADLEGNEVINNRAIHGDIAYIKDSNVVGIKRRSQQHIVGILQLNKNQKYGFTKRGIPIIKFTPLSNKFPTFMVPSKSKERKALYCVITLNKWEQTNKVPIGQIEKIIGPVGDKSSETESILYKNSIFPRRVKLVTREITTPTSELVYDTFSVDPEGCRDIDDAFHVKIDENRVEIGIHIADVASRLNLEKLDINFFSSIYLDDGQINMLPDKLTFDEASLGNGDIKRAISLIINYDFNKKSNTYSLIDFKFASCQVRNKALTYKKADKKIAKGDFSLKVLYDIAKQYSGIEDSITPIPATKIVEYFMLLYNTMTAETLYKVNPATILRRHVKANVKEESHPEELSKYLVRIQQNAAAYVRGDMVENPSQLSHQSLGFNYYTHATSPIRRYADIINQINILHTLDSKHRNFMVTNPMNITAINDFNKNLRKFYNNYKKLKLVFSSCSFEGKIYSAFITEIKEYKIKIFIPELDIDHFVRISSKKLSKLDFVQVGERDSLDTFKSVIVMGQLLEKYNEIKIAITVLPNEQLFNNKIYCQMVDPDISLL